MSAATCPVPGVETFTAYKVDGETYRNEIDALRAALTIAIGNAGIAASIMAKADDVLPVVARVVELTKGR